MDTQGLGRDDRLVPQIGTELYFFGTDARETLEGAAGYHKFLVGAPQYLVLLSENHPQAGLNAGFVMEDLILKLTDLQLDSCWVTFTDAAPDLEKAAAYLAQHSPKLTLARLRAA